MKIAVDAMGGDHAPEAIVFGTVQAAPDVDGELLLVGKESAIREAYPARLPENVRVIEATEVIEMHEAPVEALRRKKDSSLVVAANLVMQGEAEAMVSAGNTGAAAAAAHMMWKCIPNISRPAIATVFPSKTGRFVVIDSGATPDAGVQNLVEFALMGSAYAEAVLGIQKPRIALLNIGEEETKGNALTKQAYKALKSAFPEFIGNIEGKSLFKGEADVVVCDAFVGNVVLKTAQGIGDFFWYMIRDALEKRPMMKVLLGPILKATFSDIKRKTDYAEYGGAPLLGVNGMCFICHGHSNAKAIKNAILFARRGVQRHLTDIIAERARRLHAEEPEYV